MGKTAILIVLAATLGSTLLMHNAKDSAFEAERRQVDYQKEELAREIARAGYNLALGKVKRDFDAYQTLSEEPVSYQEGAYHVSATGEGNRATITSTGEYDDKQSTIEGTVERSYPLNAAVYVDGPSVDPRYYGNAFDISGYDMPPPSVEARPSPEEAERMKAVVAREQSAVDALLDGLSHMQHDNVYGQQEEDDIYRGEPYIDLEALVEDADENADETFDGDHRFAGSTTFGSADDPVVVVVNGDATLQGNMSGYGMLLVKGDVSFAAGNFTWEGIVMAYGDDGVDVDFTGNAKVYGSVVIVPEQFGESDEGDTVNFAIGGNARMQYSSEAIMRLAPDLTTLNDSKNVVLVSERTF